MSPWRHGRRMCGRDDVLHDGLEGLSKNLLVRFAIFPRNAAFSWKGGPELCGRRFCCPNYLKEHHSTERAIRNKPNLIATVVLNPCIDGFRRLQDLAYCCVLMEVYLIVILRATLLRSTTSRGRWSCKSRVHQWTLSTNVLFYFIYIVLFVLFYSILFYFIFYLLYWFYFVIFLLYWFYFVLFYLLHYILFHYMFIIL